MRDISTASPPAPPQPIGSFRNDVTDDTNHLKKILPGEIFSALFDEIPDDVEVEKLISVDESKAYLNNAAFGNSYDAVRELG